ncbi:armadillo-type protein [Suillus variegatus]|nr:armadillo-type protein [Suillus variegatus]
MSHITACGKNHYFENDSPDLYKNGGLISVTSRILIVDMMQSDTDDRILAELQPRFIVMFEPNLDFVRRIEVYRNSNLGMGVRVYFMVYQLCCEEHKYLAGLRREKESFEKLVKERGSMLLPIFEDKHAGKSDAVIKMISTRLAGGRKGLSTVPSQSGLLVIPATLTVGDYILTPDICVENGFLDQLRDMISDSNPMVVANTAAALTDIHISATSYQPPDSTSDPAVFSITSAILNKLLIALNKCSEWGRVTILNAPAWYDASDDKENEHICERVVPQFQHFSCHSEAMWVQEAVIVRKGIFRKYSSTYEGVIPTLCANLEEPDETEAKTSLIWIIGEYADKIDSAGELLGIFVDSFTEESYQVQLQTLTAVVKLFSKKSDSSRGVVQRMLNTATKYCDSPDVHRDMGVSNKAMAILNSFVNDIFERIGISNKRPWPSSTRLSTISKRISTPSLFSSLSSPTSKAPAKTTDKANNC